MDSTRELFLLLLAPNPDPAIFVNSSVWASITSRAPGHGVGPLAAFAARPYTTGAERRWCDEQLTASWTRHLRNLDDLDAALEVLERAGIRSIPLKGASLAAREYTPPFLRKPPIDIDLAIQSVDVERACEALVSAGYILNSSFAETRRYSHHIALSHPSRTWIEVHFRLSHGPFGIPIEEVFERALPFVLPNGRASWKLERADELLLLTLHLAAHRFEGFFHLYELRQLWIKAPLDCRRKVVERAVERRFAAGLALTDLAFRIYWNEPFLPPGVALPKTWLHWRLNRKLYLSMEGWRKPGRRLKARLMGRLFDLQLTDGPGDALQLMRLILRVAWVGLKRGAWGATEPECLDRAVRQENQ